MPFGTVVIGIPFYLARPELTELHGEEVGHIEGFSRQDILRYLRHEMGHVINYAYKLYDEEDWVKLFGSITQPYLEDYRPQPFSRRYVRHLPGWYAQKHPGRGLVGDVCRLDDARPRLAGGVCRRRRRAGQAGILRPRRWPACASRIRWSRRPSSTRTWAS